MEPHGSDHTPIISKWYYNSKHKEIIQTNQETQKYNFKKVNWELFTELAESKRWDNQFHDGIEQYQQKIHPCRWGGLWLQSILRLQTKGCKEYTCRDSLPVVKGD